MEKNQPLLARDILGLLQARHADDVFVPEMPCGPGAGRRIDAWAMKRTWQNSPSTAYEIKVSRGDWMQDEKLHDYLEYAHRLYLVCPWGLIPVDEVPKGVGLQWVTKTGGRFITKKKAQVQREPPKFHTALMGIMVNRVRRGPLRPEMARHTPLTGVDRYTQLLADRESKKRIGYQVGAAVREHIRRVESEARKVKMENERLRPLKEWMAEQGLDITWRPKDELEAMKAKEQDLLNGILPPKIQSQLRRLAGTINELTKAMEAKQEEEMA